MKNSRKNKFGRNIPGTINSGVITLIMAALTFATTPPSEATIIINEIDYDQPSSDTAEFIELFNTGTSKLSLDDHYIDLINGSSNTTYRSINLSGFNITSGGYFVICNDTSVTLNCDYDFTTSTSWFQNGAPDAIALFNSTGLIDSLSYEGAMPAFTEGSELLVADNNSETVSLSRLPDGFDSNDNNFDFQLGCITPGTANMSGSGDCSRLRSITGPGSDTGPDPISVAEPTTALLIGSGLVGLLGFTRRK